MMTLPVGTDAVPAVDEAGATADAAASHVDEADAASAESPATAAATVADSATAEVSDTAGAVKFAAGGGAIAFGRCAIWPTALAEPTGGCASGCCEAAAHRKTINKATPRNNESRGGGTASTKNICTWARGCAHNKPLHLGPEPCPQQVFAQGPETMSSNKRRARARNHAPQKSSDLGPRPGTNPTQNKSSHLGPGPNPQQVIIYTWARNRVHKESSHLGPEPCSRKVFALVLANRLKQ